MPLEELSQKSQDASASDPLERFSKLLITVLQRLEADPSARRVNEILLLKCDYIEEPCGQQSPATNEPAPRRQPAQYPAAGHRLWRATGRP
ncbi:hypothetical protein ULG90_22145 [Halopseudomonas pachastrellae]|nr:hypothetical protein ULG90_22145 [Halopseudomonas pachastrellae]